MRIFITGASGFIGTALVRELLDAGHQVRGMVRSDGGARQVANQGAEVHRGNLKDTDTLRSGAAGMDAVIHLAFNHDDMSQFAQSGEDERKAIETLGSALEPGKTLIVTSGTGLASGGPGHLRLEKDPPVATLPRNPEGAAHAIAQDRGLRVGIVRLPQVHDTRKQGLVTWMVATARDKGVSAYVGDGSNRWAAAPLADVARLYRLAVEKTGLGTTVYHAVEEEGVALRGIAEAIGNGLKLPVVSLPPEQAAGHFGWIGHFAGLDMPASSEWTREALGWTPNGPGMLQDLADMDYTATA